MTTTNAEALRELETLASVCPELNMANYTDDDVRHLNDWAVEVSQVIEKIATHPAKCDGNHGGPRCADPECWNDSPDAPPETIETAIQARKAAQEQLYAARERHAEEVKRLQAEIGRLLAAQLSTPEPTINWRGTHFTYQNQPCDNVTCWRLGEAARGAKPGGDLIDHGLSLLQQLQKQGFGVFSLAAKTQPATTEPGPTTRAEAEESDWRNRLTVNLRRQGAGLTKTQIRTLISYAVDGVEPDPALFDTTERKGEPATIDDNSQQWAGMDGATAWHLIYRHADGWGDTDKMMGEWLKANTSPQVPEGFALLLERAQRLVEHADFKLAGVLSSESEVREIPSKAGSWVKARHLAALRDSVRALRDAAQAKEGGGDVAV